jgi:hypothetical protein
MDRKAEVAKWFPYGLVAFLLVAVAWACTQARTGGEGRALSRQEMLSTVGRECLDCSSDYLRVDDACAADDSLGCSGICGSEQIGTGNARYVCRGGIPGVPDDGLCKRRAPEWDIVCYIFWNCTGDGPVQSDMDCNVSTGTCIEKAGSFCQECVNCVQSPLPSEKLPNYHCDKGA